MPDPGVREGAPVSSGFGGGSHDFSTGSEPGGGWAPPPSQQDEDDKPKDVYAIGDKGDSGQGDFWQQVKEEVRRVVGNWAKNAGYSTNAGQAFVNQFWGDFINYFSKSYGTAVLRLGPSHIDVFQTVVHHALNFFGSRLPFSVTPDDGGGGGGGGRRGGGGGGRRGPTPDEIRAMFDIDALADRVNQLSRMFLIQDHKDPRKVAQAYVEAIVATQAQQEIDFDTFVKKELKKDPRWNVIFAAKPDGLDEQMWIQRYVQQVSSMLGGGDESTQIAFEMAALGADPGGVQERLGRTRAVRSSSNWVNRFEDSVRSISEILR